MLPVALEVGDTAQVLADLAPARYRLTFALYAELDGRSGVLSVTVDHFHANLRRLLAAQPAVGTTGQVSFVSMEVVDAPDPA